MFNFLKRKKDKPKRAVIRTEQAGFQTQTFILNISNKELEVLRRVYERSNIEFIIK